MKKNSFSYDELINCGNGGLFGAGNAKLPLPPMLMFDRITEINDNNGAFKKGSLKAELDIKSAKYEILENETEVRVMGQSIYEDYSKALENSLKITKIFVIGSLGLFITSLFL